MVRIRRGPTADRGRGDTGTRTISARLRLLAAALLLLAAAFGGEASAQCNPGGVGIGPNLPCPTDRATSNVQRSSQAALLDIGGQFLQRFGALSSFRTAASPGNNPQGGGADTPTERYRTWIEGYGLTSHTGAQGDFTGDRRKTSGVVAGAGVAIAPGVTLGLSVDRSRTDVDVTGTTQSGRIDLTQIGAIAAFEHGPWNLGTTVVHGFGNVNSTRRTPARRPPPTTRGSGPRWPNSATTAPSRTIRASSPSSASSGLDPAPTPSPKSAARCR